MLSERPIPRLFSVSSTQEEGFVCANYSYTSSAASNRSESVSELSDISSKGSLLSCTTLDGSQPLFECVQDDFLVGLFASTPYSELIDLAEKEVLCEQMSALSNSVNRRLQTGAPLHPNSPIIAKADRLSRVAHELWTYHAIGFYTMADLRFAQTVLARYETCVRDFHRNHDAEQFHSHTHQRQRHEPLCRSPDSPATVRHNRWAQARVKLGAELETILQQRKDHDAHDPASKARFQRAVAEETARFKVGKQLDDILHMYKRDPILSARLERAISKEAVREKVGRELQGIRKAYESTGKLEALAYECENDPEAFVYYGLDSDEV